MKITMIDLLNLIINKKQLPKLILYGVRKYTLKDTNDIRKMYTSIDNHNIFKDIISLEDEITIYKDNCNIIRVIDDSYVYIHNNSIDKNLLELLNDNFESLSKSINSLIDNQKELQDKICK